MTRIEENTGYAALSVGIGALVIGMILWTSFDVTHSWCQRSGILGPSPEECASADFYHAVGMIAILIGMGFLVSSAIILAVAKPEPSHFKIRCQRCEELITYQTALTNCTWCGIRLDWSGMYFPRE